MSVFVQPQWAVCDVCRLVDGDVTQKLCLYCPDCDAWICLADRNRWDRRARAAAVAAFEQLQSPPPGMGPTA